MAFAVQLKVWLWTKPQPSWVLAPEIALGQEDKFSFGPFALQAEIPAHQVLQAQGWSDAFLEEEAEISAPAADAVDVGDLRGAFVARSESRRAALMSKMRGAVPLAFSLWW